MSGVSSYCGDRALVDYINSADDPRKKCAAAWRPPRWFYRLTWIPGSRAVPEAREIRKGSFSTEWGCLRHIRFTPDRDRRADIPVRLFRANRRPYDCWLIRK
jgi:hypothetical protein